MPRGVPVPDVRQHLFAALERVLHRDGAGGLSTRAITREAQVANGFLYTHFTGLDGFLTGYAVDRSFQLAAEAAGLSERVGSNDVVDNLAAVFGDEAWPRLSAFVRLTAARPGLLEGVRDVLGEQGAGLDAVEKAVGQYLVAERRGGRMTADVDAAALATAVTAVIHHLALVAPVGEVRSRFRGVLMVVTDGLVMPVG